MENLKDSNASSKRHIKRGPTPLAPSPSPSNAARIEAALRHKYIFGEMPPQAGRNRTA
ncbi:MAG TPA: hypothetical protein VGN04_15325 [Herbaspirillum sp.]|jgi:hypothetical protein